MKARAMIPLLIAMGLTLACSSSLDESLQGASSISGQVQGHSFELQDTVVKLFPGSRLFLVLSSAGALCLDYEAAGGFLQHKSETSLVLEVRFAGPPTTGTFPIDPFAPASTSHASGQFTVNDATCGQAFLQKADGGGTVTLTKLDDSEVAGTFDVKFNGGGSLQGSFHRTPCPDFVDRNAPGCK
ncbi:hypothetical protein LVJ94_02180 [Pendulispora rubella]|uniref:Lipoprotein n=1 Tax=Pendulispora rubella TaxID=2741070 RepID=A0ABZ2LA33_9BACT